MALIPIMPVPGVCLSDAVYEAGKKNRWVVATNVEFVAGSPQKIAGWSQATTSMTIGIPRAICVWRDNNGAARIGIGTEVHLYYILAGALVDITPLRTIESGTLTDAISTTDGSQLVDIADTAQTLVNGDWVFLSAAAAVGGIQLNGWYPVSARSGTGYQITSPVAATSTAGPAGGSIVFQYPRTTLTNPFTTTIGSTTVTVTHIASGATLGAYVIFSGATAVGGLTINGEYVIASIVDVDHYTITAASVATSSASGGGTVSVIYDIVVQQASSGTPIGYGMGAYGIGAYGAGISATVLLSNGWTLAAYGNQLLAAPIGGTIYVYNPVFGGRAYPLLNAPAALNAMFVTPERFVVALGINNNGMEMAWADQTDYTDWTTTPLNTANSGRTMVGGSFLVGGIGIRNGVSLFWSDRCIFEMNYTGGQEVYATGQVGDNCGLVSPTAMCAEGGTAYWFSDKDFWSWNGGVVPLPTDDVRAYIFDGGINQQQITKCTVSLNRAKRQVRFWGPSASANENDTGVIYQYDQQCWSVMGFGRSAGQDAELLQVPVSADITGRIFYDEIGVDANGAALSYALVTGQADISNGDSNFDIFGFIPNFKTLSGTIELRVETAYFPSEPVATDGPYDITSATGRQDLRTDGKIFAIALSADDLGTDFRLGLMRLDIQPSGARRAP